MPELVASLCTLLVLLPLALMPGLGPFLFRPMSLAVAFAMVIAYILSRTFVPARCAAWLRSHGHKPIESHTHDYEHRNEHENAPPKGPARPALRAVGGGASTPASPATPGCSRSVLQAAPARDRRRRSRPWPLVVVLLGPQLRREFFPEVDAGAFEIFVRAPSGTRIEETEEQVAAVEKFVKEKIGDDLELVITEIGVTADWSAAYTPNAGPMDAVVKVQLKPERSTVGPGVRPPAAAGLRRRPAVRRPGVRLRRRRHDPLGDERGQVDADQHPDHGKNLEKARKVAEPILAEVQRDRRRGRRPDHPAARLPAVHHRGRPGQGGRPRPDPGRRDAERRGRVQLQHPVQQEELLDRPESATTSTSSACSTPRRTSRRSRPCSTSRSPARGRRSRSRCGTSSSPLPRVEVPAEINHTNLQPTIDLTMGVHGRDLGHVADDVAGWSAKFGKERPDGGWTPVRPGRRRRRSRWRARRSC